MQSFSLDSYNIEVRRRSFQRTITLRVPKIGQLKVSCGRMVPMRAILQFVNEQADFIEKCHVHLLKLQAQLPVREFVTGEKCPFLGRDRELRVCILKHEQEPVSKKKSGRMKMALTSDRLEVFVPSVDRESVRLAVNAFYKKSGVNYLRHLVQVRAQQMNLHPTRLSFRNQRTRWGSCSSEGSISLNWRLIAAPSEIIDYVVVHELAHLRHQNHSKDFWDLVGAFDPEYRAHRKWLRTHQHLFDFLS